MLNYIRAVVPNDVKGEILEDWYKISLKEFFLLYIKPCKISYCNVSLVLNFTAKTPF